MAYSPVEDRHLAIHINSASQQPFHRWEVVIPVGFVVEHLNGQGVMLDLKAVLVKIEVVLSALDVMYRLGRSRSHRKVALFKPPRAFRCDLIGLLLDELLLPLDVFQLHRLILGATK